MKDTRQNRAKLNIFVSLGSEFITIICGLIIPRKLITSFGSEAYGATTSITQFLGYITLLEGGIGGVARAALYKPLAKNDMYAISQVMEEVKRYFRTLAFIFLPYVLLLAFAFPYISHITVLDRFSTFILVIVISISTFAQYFIGISYSVFLQADQRTYITKLITILGTVLNAVLVVVLVKMNCNIITVKFVSSLVFALRPVALWVYVKKNFAFITNVERDKNALEQKWVGLGQHLAYFLHTHTAVVVLTTFADLQTVSVYSVYFMVVNSLQLLITSFSTGMESVFGDMLAKKEMKLLNDTFSIYETMISNIATILLSVTSILILTFVGIYTKNVTDADYFQPTFAIFLIFSSYLYCLRIPYHNMTIAAGHFKQTQFAAYIEAICNIIFSVILVSKFGLVGVAIGTLSSIIIRFIYYVFYLSKNIVVRPVYIFIKRESVNLFSFALIYFAGEEIIKLFTINSYYQLALYGFFLTGFAVIITLVINIIFYKNETFSLFAKIKS